MTFPIAFVLTCISLVCFFLLQSLPAVTSTTTTTFRETTTKNNLLPKLPVPVPVPVPPSSPWPLFRQNSANSAVLLKQKRGRDGSRSSVTTTASTPLIPWSFQTQGGIFSSPVLTSNQPVTVPQGSVDQYLVVFGSSDRWIYALNSSTGTESWKYLTGNVIDSAAAVVQTKSFGEIVVVPSADGKLWALRVSDGTVVWNFASHCGKGEVTEDCDRNRCLKPIPPLFKTGISGWFEGNVVVNSEGTLLAGSDDYRMYGVDMETGKQRFAFLCAATVPFGSIWSAPTILSDGRIVFGILDLQLISFNASDPEVKCSYDQFQPSMISASPAQDSTGEYYYLGLWNGEFCKFDSKSGTKVWSFRAKGLIYSSSVVYQNRVAFASADGALYCLSAVDGSLLWMYQTLSPINSSPVLSEKEGVVIFGGGDGRIYAIYFENGQLAWAFLTEDATEKKTPYLNSSPALSDDRVFVGSDDGRMWGVPLQYCLSSGDMRCEHDIEIPRNGHYIVLLLPDGRSFFSTQTHAHPPVVRCAGAFGFRLLIRKDGKTVNSYLKSDSDVSLSINGTLSWKGVLVLRESIYYVIWPDSFFPPSTPFRVCVKMAFVGEEAGSVDDCFDLRTAAPPKSLSETQGDLFLLRRLNLGLPPVLVSLNQIGFHSHAEICLSFAGGLIWCVGAKPESSSLDYVFDPESLTHVVLTALDSNSSSLLEGTNLNVVTGGPIMHADVVRYSASPGLSSSFDVVMETSCAEFRVETALLEWLGVCDREWKFVALGTIDRFPYTQKTRRGLPAGVHLDGVTLHQDVFFRRLVARFSIEEGSKFHPSSSVYALAIYETAPRPAVVLADIDSLRTTLDKKGNIVEMSLDVPERIRLEGLQYAVLVNMGVVGTGPLV